MREKEILERVESYKLCVVWLPGGEGESCGIWFTGMVSESDVLELLRKNAFHFDDEFPPSGEFIGDWQFDDDDFHLPSHVEVPKLHQYPSGGTCFETTNKEIYSR